MRGYLRMAATTAWKMVELGAERCWDKRPRLQFISRKRLPVQGGLGAGSANAVAALVGLEAELSAGTHPSSKERSKDGAPGRLAEHAYGIAQSFFDPAAGKLRPRLGSDVPLFLIGGTVLGLDRGQEVYPLPEY